MSRNKKTLKEALKGKLTAKECSLLKRAFDIVGDIAIIEIPDELVKKEKLIAKTLLSLHNNIAVVAKKVGIHKGEFRTQNLKILAGERRKETLYKENYCFFYINPEKVYFSPRSSNERKRIASLVKPGESVLIMFSGIAPFAIVIARNSPAKEVYAVEKNPTAHEFAERNVAKNKLSNVKLFCGDVDEILPKMRKKFDRILMPLPKSADLFLDIAIKKLKKKGTLHFYDFQNENEFDFAEEKVKAACMKAKRKCVSMEIVICGQYAPRVHRICVDAVID